MVLFEWALQSIRTRYHQGLGSRVIVTGTSGGEIRFYDNQMKLLYWVHGFTVDAVKAISFNVSPRNYAILEPACKYSKHK